MRYFIVPLLIGWFLGAASGLLFMHVTHRPFMHGRHSHHMREKFAQELNLSLEQKAKVDAIFEEGHEEINAIFESNKAPLEAVRISTHAKIRILLTPEQQIQFDKMDAKMAAHFKKRFEERSEQWH